MASPIGGAFTAESQFTRESNASRIGFTVLNWHLAHWGYRFNDGKLMGPLWANMGFRDMPRREYLALLAEARARAGQERALAGRNRPGNSIALAAGLSADAYSRPLSITLPTSGIFAIQRRTREPVIVRHPRWPPRLASGMALGGTG